jgi:hypothetical protein
MNIRRALAPLLHLVLLAVALVLVSIAFDWTRTWMGLQSGLAIVGLGNMLVAVAIAAVPVLLVANLLLDRLDAPNPARTSWTGDHLRQSSLAYIAAIVALWLMAPGYPNSTEGIFFGILMMTFLTAVAAVALNAAWRSRVHGRGRRRSPA